MARRNIYNLHFEDREWLESDNHILFLKAAIIEEKFGQSTEIHTKSARWKNMQTEWAPRQNTGELISYEDLLEAIEENEHLFLVEATPVDEPISTSEWETTDSESTPLTKGERMENAKAFLETLTQKCECKTK